jgi:uncharacterized UBP type Zn finger protein
VKTANAGVEPATTWLFAHMDDDGGDDDAPAAAAAPPAAAAAAGGDSFVYDPTTVASLQSMGFADVARW